MKQRPAIDRRFRWALRCHRLIERRQPKRRRRCVCVCVRACARACACVCDVFATSLSLGAYPRQDVAAQMSLRNCFRSSATLLAAVIVPNVSVMSFSHLCLGFHRLLFPATIPCIIVFSKPLCRVTWPKYLSFCRLTKLYIQFVGR